MIYTTLKANKEHGNDDLDIAVYCEECFTAIGRLVSGNEDYMETIDNTDFNKLIADYTPRQIANAVLKYLKTEAKSKDGYLLNYPPLKAFIELDCDGEIAYTQIERLIQDGEITSSATIKDIDNKARKKGVTIRKEIPYGECYYRMADLDDLAEQYFPCNEKLVIDEDGDEVYECTNCGNCH